MSKYYIAEALSKQANKKANNSISIIDQLGDTKVIYVHSSDDKLTVSPSLVGEYMHSCTLVLSFLSRI